MANPEWLEGILSRQIRNREDITRLVVKLDALTELVSNMKTQQDKRFDDIEESVRKAKWLNRGLGSIAGMSLVAVGSLAPDQLSNFIKTFKGFM